MVAASAAALSAAVFADVYNVKFTASALVDAAGKSATRKVKGVEEEYYKKTTVTVTGVYDDSGDGKYYFWTGSGKNLEPVTNAVFEITNDTEMDTKPTAAGKAVNVGLYIGQSANLTSYFVSGGIGKGVKNKVSGDFTADLVSASGSFGGTWYGFPAYGSWSFSKNATATKNGIAAYVATQGKAAGVTTASWTGTSDIGTTLDDLRKAAGEEADTVSAMIKQIAALTGTDEALVKAKAELLAKDDEIATLKENLETAATDKESALKEAAAKAADDLQAALDAAKVAADADKESALKEAAKEAKAALEDALAAAADDKENALADAAKEAKAALEDALKEADEKAQANLGATLAELKALDDKEALDGVIETISDYLKRVLFEQDAQKEKADKKIADADKAIADYEETLSDDFEAKLVENLAAASNAVDVASNAVDVADNAVDKAYQYLDWLYSIKYDTYEYVYHYMTNRIITKAAADKTAKRAEIDDALATYMTDKAALKDDHDTLIDDTLPGETNILATVTIPGLQAAKAATATAYEEAVADQQKALDELVKYSTLDDEGNRVGNYAKYVEDQKEKDPTFVDDDAARANFDEVVYPAIRKDYMDAFEATGAAKELADAADKELAASNAVLVAKTERLAALIKARENGDLDGEIQEQLDKLDADYDAKKAKLQAELAAIEPKKEEDLAAAKKMLDDSERYEHSPASLNAEIKKAEAAADAADKAANDARNVYDEKLAARHEAEAALADIPGEIETRAAAVEAIIGVRPDAEKGYEEAVKAFYAGWGSIDETSADNVAAAKAILARLGKSVDEE